MQKCPGGEGEGRRDLSGRKGPFYLSMLPSFTGLIWPTRVCGAEQVVNSC